MSYTFNVFLFKFYTQNIRLGNTLNSTLKNTSALEIF